MACSSGSVVARRRVSGRRPKRLSLPVAPPLAGGVELDDLFRQDDVLAAMAVLEERVLHGLRAAHEQASEQAAAFLDDPFAFAVAADDDRAGAGGRGFFRLSHRWLLQQRFELLEPFELGRGWQK